MLWAAVGPLLWLLILTVNAAESALLLSYYVLDVWTEYKFLPTLSVCLSSPSHPEFICAGTSVIGVSCLGG